MRYFRIFLLNFQLLLSHRSRSLIWFLIALVGPFILIIFWRGAFSSSQSLIAGWTQSMITTYYMILSFANVSLMSHVEGDVAREDIRDGKLVTYLTKPFSYYWLKFFEEIPNRLFQFACGIVMILVLFLLFGKNFSVSITAISAIFTIIIFILAYFVSHTLKMIVGLLALWFIDIGGFFQIVEALIFILAGSLMPINFMPLWLQTVALFSPFPYIIYFPVMSIIEPLSTEELMKIISIQFMWVIGLSYFYKLIWNTGIKKFTGVGN